MAEDGVAHRSRSLGLSASLRPSPTRLIASTVEQNGDARHRHQPPGVTQKGATRPDLEAPAHQVRRAQAEERERRLDQDRVGDQQRAGDDQRRQRVGQHLADQNRHVALARDDRRLHELARL